MPAEKTDAIVLKVVDFSETSCVVTLYTRDFGKVSALAKGARRLRSPFEGAIDLLASCRIVFLRKSVDSLDLLTEAKLLRRFRSSSSDLLRFYCGLYVIELVSALTDHADPQPKLFDLVLQTIETIDDEEDSTNTELQLLRFQLSALSMLGHQPSLEECVGCGKQVDELASSRRRVAFGLLAGGVFCDTCRGGKRNVVGLQKPTLHLMRELANTKRSLNDIDGQAASAGELRGLMDQYVADLIGYRPKMQSWLKEAFRE